MFDEEGFLAGLQREATEEVARERRKPLRDHFRYVIQVRQRFPWWVRSRVFQAFFGAVEDQADYWYVEDEFKDSLREINKMKRNYTMFDVKQAEAEAQEEVREEALKAAKGKIKEKLKAIAASKAVTANLEREYEVLLRTIGE